MIKARVSIQIIGNLADMVTKALKKAMEFLKERPGIKVTKEEYAKPEKMKGLPLLSAFVEFEADFDSFETFAGMIMDFGPDSVEVISPNKIELGIEEIQNTATDMAEKFKQAGQRIQQLEALLSAQLKKQQKPE